MVSNHFSIILLFTFFIFNGRFCSYDAVLYRFLYAFQRNLFIIGFKLYIINYETLVKLFV